jgi:hypothetical protein
MHLDGAVTRKLFPGAGERSRQRLLGRRPHGAYFACQRLHAASSR